MVSVTFFFATYIIWLVPVTYLVINKRLIKLHKKFPDSQMVWVDNLDGACHPFQIQYLDGACHLFYFETLSISHRNNSCEEKGHKVEVDP
jgi:hypothetical protein